MKVKYKVIDYVPEAEWIAVEFTHPDHPDAKWVRQFEFPDFTRKEKLMDHLRSVASRIAGSWSRIPDHPKDLVIPESGTMDVVPELYLPYEPNPQYEPEPEWDEWTQELIAGDIESPTQETIPWIVRDFTPEEIEAKLDSAAEGWRQDRNWALAQSDFIFAPDVTVEDMDAWLEYRQALRDLPEQPNFPKDVQFPLRPDYKEDGSR